MVRPRPGGRSSRNGTAAADIRAPGRGARERGQIVVAFAILLPVLLALGAIVITIGNWYTHARHLQTKVDAAAFAGGGAWGFPCAGDIDARIEELAREYVGPHVQADGTAFAGTTYNPQVGGVPGSSLHAVLNGSQWYDNDSNPFPLEQDSPANASLCESKTLDVKATEDDSFPLFGVMPFFPDIKRKARVEIQEIAGLTGLLPIAVRLPQPLSAAVAFYDEATPTGTILAVKPLREVCSQATPACLFGVPPGLGQWTSEPAPGDTTTGWARFPVAARTGAVIATSFRPRCGAGTPPAGPPCLNPSGWVGQPIDTFCRQASGAVKCYDSDGAGITQTVRSGLHFVRGYPTGTVGAAPPEPKNAYLTNVSCPATGYFNSQPNSCQVQLNVEVDLGSVLEDIPPTPPNEAVETRLASNVEVRYKQVRADGTVVCDFGPSCALQTASAGGGTATFSTQGSASSPHLRIAPESRGNAVALEIRLKGSSVTPADPDCGPTASFSDRCRWFYTGTGNFGPDVAPTPAQVLASPVQRSFMGDLDRTGPVKWLRLTVDQDCDLLTLTDRIVGTDPITGADAASQPRNQERCYFLDMGLAGGMARDQDEPPIALNLGSGSSQRALIDCDPVFPNLKDEIVSGCQRPSYAANRFDTTPLCPGTASFFTTPKAAPFDTWPPFRCVLTQTTAAGNQIIQGFNERLFGVTNNPRCPGDNMTRRERGRNYWHRDNNDFDDETFAWDGDTPTDESDDWGNEIADNDPRLVTLFFTTYDSFTGPGNEVYAIVGFGNFYITGYGRTSNGGWQGGRPEDPCDEGNDGNLLNGNGNEPPPDVDFSRNTTWAWGHFVKDVTPAPFTTGGSGVLCNPEASFQPCVAVLVE